MALMLMLMITLAVDVLAAVPADAFDGWHLESSMAIDSRASTYDDTHRTA
jgi:hypothetical protein